MIEEFAYHVDIIKYIHRKQNRKWDKEVPYWTHPVWCATMILCEPLLNKRIRHRGATALLYHDAREAGHGAMVPPSVDSLVRDMTFESFDEEMQVLMTKQDLVILLKLYDKTHNLLDSTWMTKKRKDEYRLHTLRLVERVEEVYGNLQICYLARMLIHR